MVKMMLIFMLCVRQQWRTIPNATLSCFMGVDVRCNNIDITGLLGAVFFTRLVFNCQLFKNVQQECYRGMIYNISLKRCASICLRDCVCAYTTSILHVLKRDTSTRINPDTARPGKRSRKYTEHASACHKLSPDISFAHRHTDTKSDGCSAAHRIAHQTADANACECRARLVESSCVVRAIGVWLAFPVISYLYSEARQDLCKPSP